MSSKIKQAFEKTTKFSIKIRLKRILIRQLKRTILQCKMSYMRKKYFFCKNVVLNTINTTSMVLEIIINKFSCILKMMSRNTFPEPQADSASYWRCTRVLYYRLSIGDHNCMAAADSVFVLF